MAWLLAVGCGSGTVEVPEDASADTSTPVDTRLPEDRGPPPVDTSPPPVDSGVLEVPPPPEDVPPVDVTQDAPEDRGAPSTDAAPAGPRDPPPLPRYSHGMCPRLVGAPTSDAAVNMGFRTGSQRRNFRLVVPRSYDGTSDWPVLFAYHWLNASSNSFVRTGELESATEEMRFIAVVPDRLENDRGDRTYLFDWPFVETWGAEAELTFFDDLLACVGTQYRVDRRRVHAVGVSAGALWVTYLSTTPRVNHLASVESLSGGLGEQPPVWSMEWRPQPNKFPAIVLWGGASDWLGLSFDQASRRYRDALVRDRHFVVQCVHSMGHMVPPVDRPPEGGTRFRGLWQFLLDHPYGLAPGASPYLTAGLPRSLPPWCSIVR